MNRREMIAGVAKFAGILGTAEVVGGGSVLDQGILRTQPGIDECRTPLFATFTVFESLSLVDVQFDTESVRKAWSDAFGGKPPCPIICLIGGEIKLHYKEPE